jgi:8-oxo-dGTP pyrophosphatase MutT (NUDIX family)
MSASGSGFVTCSDGQVRWGRYGAAGVLFRTLGADGEWRFLLQLRSTMSHQGGTWAIPGGAIDRDESPVEGALREASEELGELPAVSVDAVYVDDVADDWRYTTVIATVAEAFDTVHNWETTDARWVTAAEIEHLDLHPGFAASVGSVLATAAATPQEAPDEQGGQH